MIAALKREITAGNWDVILHETKRREARALYGENPLFHLAQARAFYTKGQWADVFGALERAINCPSLDGALDLVIRRNMAWLIAQHEYKRPIAPPSLGARGTVVLTMTTCKRYDLFERTVLSLFSCADVHHIGSAIVVDDGSPKEDLLKMHVLMTKYITDVKIIAKDDAHRGHAKSLNIIRQLLTDMNIAYIFHLEDDFEFLFKYPLIRKSIDVLEHDIQLGQCLFNNGYKESITDDATPWGERVVTATGTPYYNHIFQAGVNPCSYWPHFSLRPGIFRAELFKFLGPFVEGDCSFEKDYASRYRDAGLKTAYLPGVYCEHIGRKTHERMCPDKPNAYSMNGTAQFGHYQWKPFLVHLERRPDRLHKLEIPGALSHIETFSAVDGSTLSPCAELNYLFRDNWKDLRSGVVGCALSHIKLWTDLARNFHEHQVYFICEDDALFAPNFDKEWSKVWMAVNDMFEPWDVMFIGTCRRGVYEEGATWFAPESTRQALDYSLGGTHAYIIRYTGARKLLTYISQNGMVNAIDTVMQRCIDSGLRVAYCEPQLVGTSEAAGNDTSDIGAQQTSLYDPEIDYSEMTWDKLHKWICDIQK